jgi:hypothetical protein
MNNHKMSYKTYKMRFAADLAALSANPSLLAFALDTNRLALT